MARVTYVKKAQQRYETVSVIDPETGEQKRTPVMMRDGTQKKTKTGRPVFMDVTREDKTRPKPNHHCDKCGAEIKPGMPYKHISPKSGPYGGNTMYRCDDCPVWQVWEYSGSTSARLEQFRYEFDSEVGDATTADDVRSALENYAAQVRELAEEKEASADSIEEGFGHETYQSAEIRQVSEDLNGFADELESLDVEDPEPEETDCETCEGSAEVDCENCDGTGKVSCDARFGDDCGDCGGTGKVSCEDCGGNGTVTPDEPTEDQIREWIDEVIGNVPEPPL